VVGRVVIKSYPSKEESDSGRELEVLRVLALAEQVERENVIAHVDLQRGPIREEHAQAKAEVHGLPALLEKARAANTADHVKSRRLRVTFADEHLAGQDVVAG